MFERTVCSMPLVGVRYIVYNSIHVQYAFRGVNLMV